MVLAEKNHNPSSEDVVHARQGEAGSELDTGRRIKEKRIWSNCTWVWL